MMKMRWLAEAGLSKIEMKDLRRRAQRVTTILPALLICLSVMFVSSCGNTSGGAVPSNSAFGNCPVCKMRVRASDDWTAEIYYKDGTKLMFESPGDMLVFYTSPEA